LFQQTGFNEAFHHGKMFIDHFFTQPCLDQILAEFAKNFLVPVNDGIRFGFFLILGLQ